MKFLDDGTVVQDGLTVHERNNGNGAMFIPYPVRGIITAVYYIDEEDNRDGETVVCDVFVSSLGIPLFKVPWLLDKASADNYIDFRPRPATKNISTKNSVNDEFDLSKINPYTSDGDIVLIQFVDGKVNDPVIVKVFPHPQSGFDGVCPSPREGVDAGESGKVRINGMNINFDKDGNILVETTKTIEDDKEPETKPKRNKKLSITFKDPDKVQKTMFVLDNTLDTPMVTVSVVAEDGMEQRVDVDGANKKIYLKNETDDGTNELTLDSNGIIATFAKDLTLTVPGKLTANVTGDMESTVGGNFKATITGNAEVTAANATVKASTKAIVDAPAIELVEGAAEALVKGNAFKTYFDTHVHNTAIGATTPPADPMPSTTLSTKVKTG